MTDYEQLVNDLRQADNLTADHRILGVCERAARALEERANCGDYTELVKALQAEVQELKRVNLEIFEDLPKLGEWVKGADGLYHCSVCGATAPYLDAFDGVIQYWENLFYCNNCGAKTEVQDVQSND